MLPKRFVPESRRAPSGHWDHFGIAPHRTAARFPSNPASRERCDAGGPFFSKAAEFRSNPGDRDLSGIEAGDRGLVSKLRVPRFLSKLRKVVFLG